MNEALLDKSCPAMITADKLWKCSCSQSRPGHVSLHLKQERSIRMSQRESSRTFHSKLTASFQTTWRYPLTPTTLSWLRVGSFWVQFLFGSKGVPSSTQNVCNVSLPCTAWRLERQPWERLSHAAGRPWVAGFFL